jgi:CRISPR system Cascade subunit CasA
LLNLLTDAWLPVIRRHTGRCFIRPAQIVGNHEDNPVIAVDWPRPDFRIATLEFLIGLLTTAFPPDGGDGWLGLWNEPPEPAELDEAFVPFMHAFALDGDGPRFLQDLKDLQSSAEPIERLLIEAPGDSTTSKNTDLLVHRDRILSLGRAAAAIALYTFQSWAPTGGAGNRVGLRGGGPLVTLIVPGTAPTLWQTVWANVPEGGKVPTSDELPRVFPWLSATLTSESGTTVLPQTAHPLQCWWGMPRRIRLDFVRLAAPRPCDLTGAFDEVQVASWRQRPRGANYAFWGGVHPLTPYYRQKIGTEKLSLHPQPGGIGYRHWLGLVVGLSDGSRVPAASVSQWHDGFRGKNVGIPRTRLIAAGYDMDNMKARGFVESDMPLPSARDKQGQLTLDDLAKRLVESADQVAGLLRSAVRNALFSAGATVKLDAGALNAVRERFWEDTGLRFFAMLAAAADEADVASVGERTGWRDHLRDVALRLFDEAAPLSADAGWSAAARTGKARRRLGIALAGYGPAGTQLLITLGLAAVKSKAAKKNKECRMSLSISAAVDWWRDLLPDPGSNHSGDRAALARLRRCATVAEAMQDPATIALFRLCGGSGPLDLPAAGLTAAVLAHVREDDRHNPRIARHIGPDTTDKAQTALLKPLRFCRLMEADGPDERLAGFRRLAGLACGKLAVSDLTAALLDWSPKRQQRWIYDYWNAGRPAATANTMETAS